MTKNKTNECKEILRQCIDQLKDNNLYGQELLMAQEICFFERNNEDLKSLIAEYTELSDEKTDGMFSIAIESWASTNH